MQSRVIVHNVVAALASIPRGILSSILQRVAPEARERRRGLRFEVAGALVGLSGSGARRAYHGAQEESGAPASRAKPCKAAPAEKRDSGKKALAASQEPSALDKEAAMKNIIRTAIAAGVEGLSFSAYERMLQRMRLASALVGSRYQDFGAGRALGLA